MPVVKTGHNIFLRSVYAENLLETFFVAAIASVLVTRLSVSLAGYPRFEVGNLHFAHVLWGGLLMLTSIVMLLAFLNHSSKDIAAVIGGAGFGLFIDELGKFVTSDNNYFFQPTVALIYIIFVLLYLSIRIIGRQRMLTDNDRVANVFEILKESQVHTIKPEENQLALKLLNDISDESRKVNLQSVLSGVPCDINVAESIFIRVKKKADETYAQVVKQWWFVGTVIALFSFASILSLDTLVTAVRWSAGLVLGTGGSVLLVGVLFIERQSRLKNLHLLVSVAIIVVFILVTWSLVLSLKVQPLSFVNWAQLFFPSISGIITVFGLLLMPVSRLQAYRMFRYSILVSIFLTQVLSFYQSQFVALSGLIADILLLLTLRYMIENEETRLARTSIPGQTNE